MPQAATSPSCPCSGRGRAGILMALAISLLHLHFSRRSDSPIRDLSWFLLAAALRDLSLTANCVRACGTGCIGRHDTLDYIGKQLSSAARVPKGLQPDLRGGGLSKNGFRCIQL